MTTLTLMNDKGSAGFVGDWMGGGNALETRGVRSVQVGLIGAGAISAVIRISGANDGRFPQTIVDFTLSGTNKTSDAVDISFPWEIYRAEIISISGTGAVASATLRV